MSYNPSHVNPVVKRKNGKIVRVYYYHRKTGERLPDDLHKRILRCAEIEVENKEQALEGKTSKAGRGSMADLITEYKKSPQYRSKSDATKYDYDRHLKWLETNFGDIQLAEIDREWVVEVRDSYADTPRKANYRVAVISIIMGYADERPRRFGLPKGWTNPAYRISKMKSDGDGYLAWPEDVFSTAIETAYPELRMMIMIGRYTGQRGIDAVKMTRAHIDNGRVKVMSQKTNKRFWIPANPALLVEIEKQNPEFLLSTTRRGRPWTENHLRHEITKLMRKIKQPGYGFHGLRKMAAEGLALAGCSEAELQAVVGWKTAQMARHYIEKVNEGRLAESGMAKLLQTNFAEKSANSD
tara:strand:- start:1400 stop:2461 length:1062 start_codon:yes stop_codon:yes gene_type:complete